MTPSESTPSVAFSVDPSAPATPLRPPWRHCVGSCHAPTALRADWQRLGSPEYPNPQQVAALELASTVAPEHLELRADGDGVRFSLPLPADAMALVRIAWEAA